MLKRPKTHQACLRDPIRAATRPIIFCLHIITLTFDHCHCESCYSWTLVIVIVVYIAMEKCTARKKTHKKNKVQYCLPNILSNGCADIETHSLPTLRIITWHQNKQSKKQSNTRRSCCHLRALVRRDHKNNTYFLLYLTKEEVDHMTVMLLLETYSHHTPLTPHARSEIQKYLVKNHRLPSFLRAPSKSVLKWEPNPKVVFSFRLQHIMKVTTRTCLKGHFQTRPCVFSKKKKKERLYYIF